jgi:uncharacterized Fe-S cluster-containing radical SAM superfamily protein
LLKKSKLSRFHTLYFYVKLYVCLLVGAKLLTVYCYVVYKVSAKPLNVLSVYKVVAKLQTKKILSVILIAPKFAPTKTTNFCS